MSGKPPASWTTWTPLQTLTRPFAKPRLPGDKRKGYRPKISEPRRSPHREPRRSPPPRRTPPRAPTRAARKPPTALARTPLQTLTRPIPQKGSPALRKAAEAWRRDLENEVAKAAKKSKGRGLLSFVGLGGAGASKYRAPGKDRTALAPAHGAPGRTIDELRGDLAYFHLKPKQQAASDRAWFDARHHPDRVTAAVSAPATKALDLLSRPNYAVAGATSAALRGKDVSQAAVRGLKGKEHKTFGTVLREHGVKRGAGGLGFLLDVGLDPTTYLTGGLTSVTRSTATKTAVKAARQVERDALAKGATKSGAKAAARKMRTSVLDMAEQNAQPRGIEVKFAGRRIGGKHQVRATAATGQAVRKATRAVENASKPTRAAGAKVRGAGLTARDIAAHLNAEVRPVGLSREEHLRARQIAREYRSERDLATRHAAGRAQTIRVAARPDEHEAIRHAIESDDLSGLHGAAPVKLPRRHGAVRGRGRIKANLTSNPARLQKVAETMTADFNTARDAARQAGVEVGHVGAKPPVEIPSLAAETARHQAARKTASTAKRDQAKAERAQVEHQMPGSKPGPLTAAQKTVAQRRLTRAVQAKSGQLAEFRRLHRQARSTDNPALSKRLVARADRARKRAGVAQDEITHWTRVLQTREVPGAAPRRGAVAQAQGRTKQALTALTEARTGLRAGKAAQRKATKLKATRALEPQGYFPRVPKALIEDQGRVATVEDLVTANAPKQGRAAKATPTKHRTVTESIEVLRRGDDVARAHAEKQSADPALVYQTYMGAMGRETALANANRKLFAEGRPVQHGKPLDVGDAERVYTREGSRLRELDPATDAAEIRQIEAGKQRDPGNYVVLPKPMHDLVNVSGDSIGGRWARAMGIWKGTALATTGYLMRNMTGDLFNALGAQNPGALARNWMRAQRGLNERARSDRAYRWFEGEMNKGGKGTTTKINGEEVPYSALAALAEATGAIGGRVRDIMEQATTGKKGLKRPTGTAAWHQAGDRVENMARLATFIGGLERGLTPERAADVVRDMHFDYGELTKVEKAARNVALPFYTFPARNIPLQAKLLAKRPGLAASYAHGRDEATQSSGIEPNFLSGLDPYEAKQLSFPIRFKGKLYTVSSASPLTDLNAITPDDPKSAKSWLKLLATTPTKRGLEMLGPYKVIPEIINNYSLFYGDTIAKEGQDLTPVPGPVARMADELGPKFVKFAGLQKKLDPTTGKLNWAWDKRKDYAIRGALPGPLGGAYRASQTATARGFNPVTEALGTLGGVRAKPFDSATASINRAYDERAALKWEIGHYHQRGVNLQTNPTPELLAMQAKLRKVEGLIDEVNRGHRKFYKGRWITPSKPTQGLAATGSSRASTGATPRAATGALRALTGATRAATR